MSAGGCPGCACAADAASHVLVAALLDDDLDRALDLGLLDAAPCPACSSACATRLITVRDERRTALAARERYRARAARLARRAAEKRPAAGPAPSELSRPPLPGAAADALARAMARAKAARQ